MSGGFKGQGMGVVISWLLSNKNSGGQSIGLAGVTGLKGHTILTALGLQGYNMNGAMWAVCLSGLRIR